VARNRNLPGLLALLALAIGALILSRGGLGWPGGTAAPAGAAAPRAVPPAAAAPLATRSAAYPDVNLEGLAATRTAPADGGRNPFSLDAPAALVPPVAAPGPLLPTPSSPAPSFTPSPAGPAPVNLKFIGIINLPRDGGRLAVLSDGDFVYHGRQGDIVEGQYRILSIGEESIELERTDGQGTRVLPLSGA
jgi:hypothetical protein